MFTLYILASAIKVILKSLVYGLRVILRKSVGLIFEAADEQCLKISVPPEGLR